MHHLGESCGPLTVDELINVLKGKEKLISELEDRVCELKWDLSIQKEERSSELENLYYLLNEQDAIIKEIKRDSKKKIKEIKQELEERPTQKLVDHLREKLNVLEVEITQKSNLLETAEKTVVELNAKIEKSHSRWIKGSSSNITTNNAALLTTQVKPIEPAVLNVSLETLMASNANKLIFLRKENRTAFYLTDLFGAPAKLIGRGTFGTYKVVLDSGLTIAMKLLRTVNLPENEFQKNVARIGKLEHNNILPLIAYYYGKNEKLLVSDYIATGSLSAILHGSIDSEKISLNWKTRAKIILQVSESISYIHSVDPTFCHGNIRSSNVLLSPTYEVFLSDHGLYSLAYPASYYSTNGYQAPEITNTRDGMSQKADVYSFGVLMMEILTGKKPYHATMGVDLVKWVRLFASVERIGEALDVDLVGDQMARGQMMQLMHLALICTGPVSRPTMEVVVVMINKILKIDDQK